MLHYSLHPIRVAFLLCGVFGIVHKSDATGITADVGLTPPHDRWIFRTQLRYAQRDDPTLERRNMKRYVAPFVLAYGVLPELTTIVRQSLAHRKVKMSTGTVENTGVGDLAIITKYRLLRLNHPEYIVGIAPTLGVELPLGDKELGSDTWDIFTGIYLSGRRGSLGADLNLEYKSNGIENRKADRPGDEFTATLAIAHQFSLNSQATTSLWPVLEVTYTHIENAQADGQKDDNSGEDVALVSPGLKFAYQSFMLEFLLQLPIHQEQNGEGLKRAAAGLFGIRFLF